MRLAPILASRPARPQGGYTPGMSTASLADIGLAPAQLRAVERKARRAGTTARDYVRALVERDLVSGQSFDEILRPVRADFRRSGVTEAQLDRLVDRARRKPNPMRPAAGAPRHV